MKTRILVAAVGLPVLLVVLLALPEVVTAILLAAMCVVAIYELMYQTGLARNLYLLVASSVMAIGVCFWSYGGCPQAAAIVGISLYWIVMACVLIASHGKLPFSSVCIAFIAGVVIPLLFSSLVRMLMMPNGRALVLLPLVITFSADSGAYFVGVAFGRHKMAPILSPKKSWEGAAGGIVTAMIAVTIYCLVLQFVFDFRVRYVFAVIYGLLGSAVCILGDLSFSAIKRQTGIKDYGTLLPGHGGILDRFDSTIFVAPLVEALLIVIPLIEK